ncbi:hypothetical protein MTR_7g027245 [Medicago truncatula]|uniref:Uncharacterized protein n=1 Tax=Medicago truncatula TaxID=3880 RepID=A0A072TWS8_MEDTR|nr:hypothetical protein MTR_7g027245 [Medicago truncatula]
MGMDTIVPYPLGTHYHPYIAINTIEELVLLMSLCFDGRDTLNLETYETMVSRTNNQLKNPNIRIEASRNSGDVIMNAFTLVEMFIDPGIGLGTYEFGIEVVLQVKLGKENI